MLCALLPLPMRAADEPEWVVAPYLWALDLRGTVGISGQSVTFDLGVEDLARNVKIGAMGYVRRDQGRHRVYAEGLGMRFEDPELDAFNDLPVKADAVFLEVGYGYRFPMDSQLPNGGIIDLTPYLGLRLARLDVQVDVPDFPPLAQDLAADERWLDPVIGVLAEGPVGGRLGYAIKLDAAGLGLGRSQYRSAALYASYALSPGWNAALGYRYARFTADPGGDNDLRMQLAGDGPALGLAYRWH